MGILQTLGIGGRSRSSTLPVGNDIKNTLPDATYLESMQKALQGDVASTLSGGEKLAALGALLKSASRGSQVSPQAVMASVQQTAQNRAATQLQLAQIQAKAQQDAALAQNQNALIASLPKQFQDIANSMDPEKRGAWIANLRMQPTYKRVQEDGKWKTKVTYLQSGLVEDAPFQLPANLEKGYLNGKAVWYDKDSGQPFIDPTTGQPAEAGDPMSPAERERLSLSQQRIAKTGATGGRPSGGRSSGNQYTYMNLMTTGGRMARYAVPKNNPNGPKIFVGFVKDQPLVVGSGALPLAPK